MRKLMSFVSLGVALLSLAPVTGFAWGICVLVSNGNTGNNTDYVSWNNGNDWKPVNPKYNFACTSASSGTVWVAIGPHNGNCTDGLRMKGFSAYFDSSMWIGSNPYLTITGGNGAVLFDGNGAEDPNSQARLTAYSALPNYSCHE